MKDVDILAELRSWRDEFARSHNYDLAAMVATIRNIEIPAGHPVVRGEPRRPTPFDTVNGIMPSRVLPDEAGR